MLPIKKILSIWSLEEQLEDSWDAGFTENFVTIGVYNTKELAEKAAEYRRREVVLERYHVDTKNKDLLNDDGGIDVSIINEMLERMHPELADPLKDWLSEPGTVVTGKAVFDKIIEIAHQYGFPTFKVVEMTVWGEDNGQTNENKS